MILLYRLSSFAVLAFVALGFALLIVWTHPFVSMGISTALVALTLARLLGWQWKTFQFWHLLGTPLLFLLAGYGPFMLLGSPTAKIGLTMLVAALLFLFVEHVFAFVHLPVAYQPFTLEYLTQLLHILSVFFLSVLGFGLLLFLQVPLWLLSIAFFLMLFFIVYGTLWAGKVEPARARPYALAGALLATELFAAVSFLPSGFYTNAAFIALGVYIFLGLSRAQALHKLSKEVLRRYLVLFVLLSLVIILTSQWV